MEVLQTYQDEWMEDYNNDITYQGKMCCGCTLKEVSLDGKTIWAEKISLNLN